MSSPSFIINRLIRKYGEDVNIRRITKTVDADGDVTTTYPVTINTRAQINELTGYSEAWESPGITENADYIMTFKWDTKIDNGDIVQLPDRDDEECEVTERLVRKTGRKIDYIEVLAVKRK